MSKEIPFAVKHEAAAVACATCNDFQLAAVWFAPQHTTDAGKWNAGVIRLTKKCPVSPMIWAAEITVPNKQVTHRHV